LVAVGQLSVAEASAFDLLETLDDMGGKARFTRLRFGQMARQVSEGAALTFRDADGLLVCVAGLWPEPGHVEAWLAVGPAFRRRFRSALDQVEDALVCMACANAPVEVRAYVRFTAPRRDRVAGARMATWLGFERTGEEATPVGPVDVFVRRFGGPAA
jgi:hypothetical protein